MRLVPHGQPCAFQDRYKSKPIESNDYFMQAIRYIHDNPIELGCRPEAYQWSSYQAYLGEGGHLDRSILFSLIGGRGNFESFSKSGRKDTYVLNSGRSMTVFEQERKARGVLDGMDPHDVWGFPVHLNVPKLFAGCMRLALVNDRLAVLRGLDAMSFEMPSNHFNR